MKFTRLLILSVCLLGLTGIAYQPVYAMADVKSWINKIKPGTFPGESQKRKNQKEKPKVFTSTDVEILSSLQKKEELLIAKEKEIQKREKALRTLEQQIERKLDQMKELAEKVEKERMAREEMDNRDIAKMVKFYETMDPENTATFFNQLDRLTAAQILMRMNPRKASALMQRLNPQVAVEITQMVTRFKQKQNRP